MEQERLGPPNGKCRDHDGAAPTDGSRDDLPERVLGIAPVVPAIAVGRLHDEVIGGANRCRVDHHRVVVPAEVAREDGRDSLPEDLDDAGAEYVSRAIEPEPRAVAER